MCKKDMQCKINSKLVLYTSKSASLTLVVCFTTNLGKLDWGKELNNKL